MAELHSTKDYWGFYQVGPFKTYSKLDAIEIASKLTLPISWNFNQSEFSKFDWSQEPLGSLEFWYQQRALQLRNRYEYLVLFYSGGADSHNMLMSFVQNNIFVDEIVQFHTLTGNFGNKASFANDEVFATSAPLTKTLIENNSIYKNTKHRLIDLTSWQQKMFFKSKYKWDYFYETNTMFSPANAVWGNIREVEPDYKRIIDSGKKMCFVWGIDKPNIDYTTNECRLVFNDAYASAIRNPADAMQNLDNEFDEAFYFSPTLPQLVSKQAHVVKRFLELINDSMVDEHYVSTANSFVDEFGDQCHPSGTSPIATVTKHNKKYHLMPAGLHKLIYPHWDPKQHIVLCRKPGTRALNLRDEWMTKGSAREVGLDRFFKGLIWMKQHIIKLNPEFWNEFDHDHRRGIYSGKLVAMKNHYKIG